MTQDHAVEAATAPNSGVSLEVGATYRTPTGQEVELIDARVDRAGLVPVYGDKDAAGMGTHWREEASRLVRVVPTPADRYIMLRSDGCEVPTSRRTLEEAQWMVKNLNAGYPESAPYRIAKLTFAGWVGEQP